MKPATQTTEMPFAEYMERALYGPAGYYSSGKAHSGREGDYFTAPDVGPVFGRLLASLFVQWQARMKRVPFHLVEMGAGEGALAQSIAQALWSDWRPKARHFAYTAIERSPARRARLEPLNKLFNEFRILPSVRPLADNPVSGCLFANELVDAFPVHRIRCWHGQLEEAFVEKERGEPQLLWQAPSTPLLQVYLDRLGLRLPEGYRTEINLAMGSWVREVAQSMVQGLVVVIDYGWPAHQYYSPERDQGTLRAFRKHRVFSDVLSGEGLADLTADVDFTSLALDAREAGLVPLAFMDLGSFLVQAAKDLFSGDRKVERPVGLRYLVHPEGLGSVFQVLILGKNVDPAEWVFDGNRLKRLGLEERV
jgi:SAM-dependent MidA family methyltransferase